MSDKPTSRNQSSLLKKVVEDMETTEYSCVTRENDRVVLASSPLAGADAVRAKLAKADITDVDIAEAKIWARRSPPVSTF